MEEQKVGGIKEGGVGGYEFTTELNSQRFSDAHRQQADHQRHVELDMAKRLWLAVEMGDQTAVSQVL